MFVKPLVKYNKTTKQRYNIYQLCESFRLDDRIRHRVIIGLGKLDELPDELRSKVMSLKSKIDYAISRGDKDALDKLHKELLNFLKGFPQSQQYPLTFQLQ